MSCESTITVRGCLVEIDKGSILKHYGVAVVDDFGRPITVVLSDGQPLPRPPYKVELCDEVCDFRGGFA